MAPETVGPALRVGLPVLLPLVAEILARGRHEERGGPAAHHGALGGNGDDRGIHRGLPRDCGSGRSAVEHLVVAAAGAADSQHGERLVPRGGRQAHGAGPHESLQDFQAVGGLGDGEGVLAEGIFEAGGLSRRVGHHVHLVPLQQDEGLGRVGGARGHEAHEVARGQHSAALHDRGLLHGGATARRAAAPAAV